MSDFLPTSCYQKRTCHCCFGLYIVTWKNRPRRLIQGWTVVQWLALWLHSRNVLGWILGQGISVRTLHVLPVSAWVFFRYSSFPPQSKNSKTGSSGILAILNCPCTWIDVWFLYISSAINWLLVESDPTFTWRCLKMLRQAPDLPWPLTG